MNETIDELIARMEREAPIKGLHWKEVNSTHTDAMLRRLDRLGRVVWDHGVPLLVQVRRSTQIIVKTFK